MVRDSTHRPRKTEELLGRSRVSQADGVQSPAQSNSEEQLASVDELADTAALMTFISTSSSDGDPNDEGNCDEDDDDTIVMQSHVLLDEEIQSTIDELEGNLMQLRPDRQASDFGTGSITNLIEADEIKSSVFPSSVEAGQVAIIDTNCSKSSDVEATSARVSV